MKTLHNNQIDVIIEARMTSTRLPGKIMLPASGKPLLDHMIDRLLRIQELSNVIIATTINDDDDCIVEFAEKKGVPYFRGSEEDVLGRVVNTAQHFNTDIIVEITSDNPLLDPTISSKVITTMLEYEDEVDYVSNDAMVTLGFNTRAFKRTLLEDVEKKTNHPVDREHVVNYIVKHPEQFRTYEVVAKEEEYRPDLRLTLDTQEDYQVIKAVFEALYPQNPEFSSRDIYEFLDTSPEIRSLNQTVVQQTYKY